MNSNNVINVITNAIIAATDRGDENHKLLICGYLQIKCRKIIKNVHNALVKRLSNAIV